MDQNLPGLSAESLDDIADQQDRYGNTRARQGVKRGKSQFKNTLSFRNKLKRAQRASATVRNKAKPR